VDRERFWELMEATRTVAAGDCAAQGEQLFAMLRELSPDEIVAFDRISDELLDEAHRWDLQGA
jgi:Protein of unknown function (DUF4240)